MEALKTTLYQEQFAERMRKHMATVGLTNVTLL
jgi:hypothetical protein